MMRQATHISMIKLPYFTRLMVMFLLLIPCILARANDDPFAEPSLRAGFYALSFPDFSVEDVEVSIKLLSEELGRDVGIETKVFIYEDIKAMRNDFEQGKINFVVSSSLSLVTEFDNQSFAEGFRLARSSEAPDQVLVLAQKKSAQTKFKEFKGKRLVLGQFDPLSDLVMDYLSWNNFKQGYKASFKPIPRERKAHQLILKLFFDQADITCVYRQSYQLAVDLNPQLLDHLQIIERIDNIPQGGGLFHIKTPVAFRELVIEQALKMSSKPRGRQLLEVFNADEVLRASYGELLSVKKLHDAWSTMVSHH